MSTTTTTSMKGSIMRITAKHPIRAAIAGLPTYHDSKADMVQAVQAVCADHDMVVEYDNFDGDNVWTTNSGWALWPLRVDHPAQVVCDCCADKHDSDYYDNCVAISWYTMQSGRIELTVYVS